MLTFWNCYGLVKIDFKIRFWTLLQNFSTFLYWGSVSALPYGRLQIRWTDVWQVVSVEAAEPPASDGSAYPRLNLTRVLNFRLDLAWRGRCESVTRSSTRPLTSHSVSCEEELKKWMWYFSSLWRICSLNAFKTFEKNLGREKHQHLFNIKLTC